MSLFDDPHDDEVRWRLGSPAEVARLLHTSHYLGPRDKADVTFVGVRAGEVVAAQLWGAPSSRRLPADGTWWELSRWCLTPAAGPNAGTRQHAAFVRWVRAEHPEVTTFVSYSDPSEGHTGALYRACNWWWAPTWHRLAPPPSGNGRWSKHSEQQEVKDRWVFPVADDDRRADLLALPYPQHRPILAGLVQLRADLVAERKRAGRADTAAS